MSCWVYDYSYCPNYENNPKPSKKPKHEPITEPKDTDPPPVTEPPVFTDFWTPPIDEYLTPPPATTDEDDYDFPPKTAPAPVTEDLSSLTPVYSAATDYSGTDMINLSTVYSQSNPQVQNQGPEPDWFGTNWDNGFGEYDYSNPIDITGLTPSQICPLLFKNGYAMKGLRQLYYEKMPFADETAPTVAEIDAWNIEVILHLRRLVGNNVPLEGDPRLYLESRWADERRSTRYWDAAYPGTDGSAYGPCAINSGGNQHCGATFVPSFEDQTPYLTPQYPGLEPFNFISGGAEGIGSTNTDLPWAIKIVRQIGQWICTEGTGGHAGPFFTRTKVGISFWVDIVNGTPAAGTTVRFKWLGNLNPEPLIGGGATLASAIILAGDSNIFDGQPSNPTILSNWRTIFRLDKRYHITGYKLWAFNDRNRPKDYIFEGSHDGTTWVTLDTQNDNPPPSQSYVEITINNPGSPTWYQYYQIRITGIVATNFPIDAYIGELQLIGV